MLVLTRRTMNAPKFITSQFGHDDRVHRKVVGKWAGHHLLSDPPTPTELHGTHVDFVHLGRANVAIRLFDQDARYAAPSKFNCKGQSNRTAANDQYRYLDQKSFPSLGSEFPQYRDTLSGMPFRMLLQGKSAALLLQFDLPPFAKEIMLSTLQCVDLLSLGRSSDQYSIRAIKNRQSRSSSADRSSNWIGFLSRDTLLISELLARANICNRLLSFKCGWRWIKSRKMQFKMAS